MNFQRTRTIGQFPEHQAGHVIRDWDITDENSEFWTIEKDCPRPSLKEGENPWQEHVIRKDEWKIVN